MEWRYSKNRKQRRRMEKWSGRRWGLRAAPKICVRRSKKKQTHFANKARVRVEADGPRRSLEA